MENDKPNEPDKRIRAKLDANELRPDAALWNDIEKELDKSKRRAGFFRKRYLLLLLLLLGGGGVGVFTLQHRGGATVGTATPNANENQVSTGNAATESNNVHQSASQNNSTATTTATNTSSENESIVKLQTAPTSTSDNNHQRAANHQRNVNAVAGSANNSSTDVASVNHTQSKPISTGVDVSQFDKPLDQPVATSQQPMETGNNKITATGNPAQASNSGDDNVNQKNTVGNSTTSNDNHQAVTGDAVDSTTLIANGTPTNIDTVSQSNATVDTSILASAATDTIAKPVEQTQATNPVKAKRPARFYAGPYLQYNSVSKTIGASGTVRPEYLQRRRAEEKKTTALSYGLKAGVDLNRFALQTGVGIRGYAENVQYENRKLCYDVLNKGSQAKPLYDTVHVHSEVSNVVGTKNGKAVNRYVEVPLMFGYRIGSDLFFVRPVVGTAVAFPASWKSRYLNESVDGLVDPHQAGTLRPVLFNLVAEITASRSLTKNLFVNFGMNYNRNLSNVFKPTSGLTQRYAAWGGQLGLTYRF